MEVSATEEGQNNFIVRTKSLLIKKIFISNFFFFFFCVCKISSKPFSYIYTEESSWSEANPKYRSITPLFPRSPPFSFASLLSSPSSALFPSLYGEFERCSSFIFKQFYVWLSAKLDRFFYSLTSSQKNFCAFFSFTRLSSKSFTRLSLGHFISLRLS